MTFVEHIPLVRLSAQQQVQFARAGGGLLLFALGAAHHIADLFT